MAGTDAVLVTGGTGSLGQALIKHYLGQDKRVVCYARDEFKMWQLVEGYPRVISALGDVRDYGRIVDALRSYRVSTVIHTAAYKQVPQGDHNTQELVKTNLAGTTNVVRACIAARVESLVVTSSDKSVEATSAYGMTKALAERVVFEQAQKYGVRFMCTRYGNVASSRGGVLTRWLPLAQAGKEIPVVGDGHQTRFWITMDQAVDTIQRALGNGKPGEVWIPPMDSAEMGDLASHIEKRWKVGRQHVESRGAGEKDHELALGHEEAQYAFNPLGFPGYIVVDRSRVPPSSGPFTPWSSSPATMIAGDMAHLVDSVVKDLGL